MNKYGNKQNALEIVYLQYKQTHSVGKKALTNQSRNIKMVRNRITRIIRQCGRPHREATKLLQIGNTGCHRIKQAWLKLHATVGDGASSIEFPDSEDAADWLGFGEINNASNNGADSNGGLEQTAHDV